MIAFRPTTLRWLAASVLVLFLAVGTTAYAAPPDHARGTGPPDHARGPGGNEGERNQPGYRGPITTKRATCFTAPAASGTEDVTFSDVTEEEGLGEVVTDRLAHGSGWGDVNNDAWIDLLSGDMAEFLAIGGDYEKKPDQLSLGGPDGFTPDSSFPKTYGWTSGLAFADFDGDGDDDLVLSRHAEQNIKAFTIDTRGGSVALRNDDGDFRQVEGAIPPSEDDQTGGRSVAILDYDGDGLLDIFLTQDRYSAADAESTLLRSTGNWEKPFEDVTEEAGLPTDIEGFGVTATDLTSDGWADLYVAGSNRMFVANGDGTFREADPLEVPEPISEGDFDTGVSVGDLNGDGRPDIAIANHYRDSTLNYDRGLAPVRVYLNRGLDEAGDPSFENVTEKTGLPTDLVGKGVTLSINDFDNDGRPDILSGVSAAGEQPAVFRGLGANDEGVPQFAVPEGLGETPDPSGAPVADPYLSWVSAPTGDYDRDGRLDVALDYFFIPEAKWNPLLRNETDSGHWLSMSVDSEWANGVGSKVEVYRAGGLGDSDALIGSQEITATDGYGTAVPHEAHFGLGEVDRVDVRVKLPHGSPTDTVELRNVPADRHLQLPYGCKDRGKPSKDDYVEANDVSAEQPLVAGQETTVSVAVENSSRRPTEVTAELDVPEGWTSGSATRTLKQGRSATLEVPVTPSGPEPSLGTVVAKVSAGREAVSGRPYSFGVFALPSDDSASLALDAGGPDTPVLDGYQRLSPTDSYAPAQGYGWIEGSPEYTDWDYDRASISDAARARLPEELGPLRRDFVKDQEARTLRVDVPAGRHQVSLLNGNEIRATRGLVVSSQGQQLAESEGTPGPGVYEWIDFELNGGPTGRTIDLTFSSPNPGPWQHFTDIGPWNVGGLVMLEED